MAEGRESGALTSAAEVAYLARAFAQAVTWVQEAVRVAPDNIQRNSMYGTPVLLGLSLVASGDEAPGREVLLDAIEHYGGRIEGGADSWIFPWGIAVSHAALGNDEAALQWLGAAYDAGFRLIRLAQDEPALDALRGDPRLEDWMRRIHADLAAMRERVVQHERAAGPR